MNKKFLTKLLYPDFRKKILFSISSKKIEQFKIRQYARYVVDSCIINRSEQHKNDKEYGYGFSPVQFLCAVKKDRIEKKIFEFNTINHFLREKDGDSAVEVVAAILVKWTQEDKTILNFDIQTIDDELARIEAEYVANEKEKTNQPMSENIDVESNNIKNVDENNIP